MLKKIIGLLCLAFALRAQNPNTSAFPGAIATDNTLLVASNNAQSVLALSLNSSATTFTLITATNFIAPTAMTIGSEIVMCTTLTGSVYSGCTRGFQGTTAAAHSIGTPVFENMIAWYANQSAAEIKAIEAALGTNFNGGGTSSKTADYTLKAVDNGTVLAFNGTSLTATLPNPPPSAKWTAQILNLNSTSLTISNNSLTINGVAAALTLSQYQTAILSTDGFNYFQMLTPTGSTAIGATVSGGTTCAVLFVGATPILGQDASNLCYYPATHDFVLGGNLDASFRFDVQSSGTAGTARFWDQTATTGITHLILQNGQGQGTSNLLDINNYMGTNLGGILYDASFYGRQFVSIPSIGSGSGSSLNGSSGFGLEFSSDKGIGWSSTLNWYDLNDVTIGRISAGILEISNGHPSQRFGTKLEVGGAFFDDNTPTTGVTQVTLQLGEGQLANDVIRLLDISGNLLGALDSAGEWFTSDASTGNKVSAIGGNGLFVASGRQNIFCSSVTINSCAPDITIQRSSAGLLELNNGTLGTWRDLKLRNIIITGACTGCGTPGSAYTLCASGCTTTIPSSPFTVTAATHGEGANAIAVCLDASGNQIFPPACSAAEPSFNGDLTFTYSGTTPAKIIIR